MERASPKPDAGGGRRDRRRALPDLSAGYGGTREGVSSW